jgi:hypothetical protein
MKKAFFTSIIMVFVQIAFGQAPAAMNYQATARTSSGELLAEKALTIRIGILHDNTLIWQEDHNVVTNQFGHFSIKIGSDEALNGAGNAGSFGNINWGTGNHMVNLQVDDGNGFSDMGNNELLSVPYALYAAGGGGDLDPTNELVTELFLSGSTLYLREPGNQKTVDLAPIANGSFQSPWIVEGNTVSLADKRLNLAIGSNVSPGKFVIQGDEMPDDVPLFEVLNFKGESVLSGYNNGTFINVETSVRKGLKGGFAVGGYNKTKAEPVQEYFRVTSDSIRVTINDNIDGKGLKGGFAVGGYSSNKSNGKPYFYVEKDATLIQGRLELNGEDVVATSDSRYKTNIVEIEHVLDNLLQLRGVYFDWNQLAKETLAVSEKRQIGLLAQEIGEFYPELVVTNREGYKMVNYSKLTPVLIQAIREQQVQIEELQQKDQKISELEERISALEQLLNK